ncbi:DNA replication ATP-dependent helicase/nuclease DNA2 isoform X2 [Hydra vulgaris]|uniref:DNA replication ATP-dependent helicase/nuclease DNA2 isoform X2 n=2 Tax=Hydra vulgaris TaxID=6087 RepID=UPI001F5EA350|nr:DNA replication ATP-dependent helicase/nuclease DNA2 [Hydra vulgaris]
MSLKSSSKKRKCYSELKHAPIGSYFKKVNDIDKQKCDSFNKTLDLEKTSRASNPTNNEQKKSLDKVSKKQEAESLNFSVIKPIDLNKNGFEIKSVKLKLKSKNGTSSSEKVRPLLDSKSISEELQTPLKKVTPLLDCKSFLEDSPVLSTLEDLPALSKKVVPLIITPLTDCNPITKGLDKKIVLSKATKRTKNESDFCSKPKRKTQAEIQERFSNLIQDDDDDDFLTGYGYDNLRQDNKLTSIKTFSKPGLDDSSFDLFEPNHASSDILKTQCVTNDSQLVSDDSLLEIDEAELVEDLTEHKVMLLRVKEVTTRFYAANKFDSKKEILIIVESTKGSYRGSCHLREDWIQTEIEINDLVYVSGLSPKCFQCVLDNSSSHFITLYPNTLISGTCISTGIFCDRNAVLNEQFKMSEQNEAMLLGTFTHNLLEWALQNNLFSKFELEKQAQKMLCSTKFIELLYSLDIDEKKILLKLEEYYSSISDWQTSLLNPSGKEIYFKTGQEFQSSNDNAFVHINRIIDIEENIWAPRLGLKGKIDVSVELIVHRKPKKNKYIVPLELKTGKMFSEAGSIEHRAQVAIYTMLMSEKYNQSIDAGLLLYLKTKHLQGIPVPEKERRALIIKRNSIARKLTLENNNLYMPSVLGDKRKCARCFQNQTCMLYHKAVENGNANTSGVDSLFMDLTNHINNNQLDFFKKWYELVMIEIKYDEQINKNKYFWLDTSQHCEMRGECLSRMNIVREDKTSDQKYHYIFCNQSAGLLHFCCGDRVVVSEENKKVYNIATGYVLDVSGNSITISVDRKIASTQVSSTFRIDKDGFLTNYKTSLSTLVKLYKKDSPRDEKIRRLIIDKESPQFSVNKNKELKPSQPFAINGAGSVLNSELSNIYLNLNPSQKAAIEKCLVTEDYLIMLGMPGAGKSTTIACLVRALVSMGKSVLLTSYTHSAVDTILVKLIDAGFNSFLRIGENSRVHSKIAHLTNKEQTKQFSSTAQLKEFYNKQSVVATTCLGIGHPIFLHKCFDYCIVDEASQVTLPVCIGPLRYANAFILVGDHNQLPPLVQSPVAREKGLDVSLFCLLTKVHPKAVISLNHQYRMNSDIMLLTNSLIYNNAMICGNDDVASARIKLPLYEKYKESYRDYILQAMDPVRSVVFIDTDSSEMFRESKSSHGVTNHGEAFLVRDIVRGFLHCGLKSENIGVISPYRQQLKVIRKELSVLAENVEVDTIDKYQGKDKPCIIVSLVRSNESNEVGDLLTDWRRVNVAITRAKTKLILIGSATTVKQSIIFEKMLKILQQEKWILSV